MMLRMILVSIGTLSSSAARTGAAKAKTAALRTKALAVNFKVRRVRRMSWIMALIPVINSQSGGEALKIAKEFNHLHYPTRDYHGGSGRFYGAARNHGFIQEADHPGNDSHVR